MADLIKITKKDGTPYTIRVDRSRYFYPSEWLKFFGSLRLANKPLFDFLINTGTRIEEAVYIRAIDFDFNRNNVRVWKTKTKAKKGETFGKPRTIPISSQYCKRVKSVCQKRENYLFWTTPQAANQLLKRKLESIGVIDYYNFSLHNVRKTHGMWLKSLGVPAEEICLRLGHDYNTYLKHYGSAEIFSTIDIRQIEQLLGDLYQRKRFY